jgi:hypothetical protein
VKGQWVGRYDGTNEGKAVLDLDDEGTHYRGHAYAWDDNASIPPMVAEVVTPDKEPVQAIEVSSVAFLRPGTTRLITPAELADEYPDVVVPTKLQLKLRLQDGKLEAEWVSDIGTNGSASLEPSACDADSQLHALDDITDWDSFKTYALSLPHRQFIFRGQDICRRLRTAFHRSRRKDLIRYMLEDLPEAHRSLTARTRHLFDLSQGVQNGAFLNLLQHHGYPTPLLDWSYSPFVAAFFAYRYRRHREPDDNAVRIFMFDRGSWVRDWPQIQTLAFAQPHFSILEALTIENTRAIPQQALSSVTNVDDIEDYIRSMEERAGKSYLQAVDLPFAERRKVMQELSVMGITAGSLFPGLDGACEELRGRFFYPFD